METPGDTPEGQRNRMEECKPDVVSDQFTQSQHGDLKHIFQVLEEKIITFVKNELKRFKRLLSPDYQENFESIEEDESDVREGALKMALHFLRNMELLDLVDKLQENALDIICQTELKGNLKNKYQSVFEGIHKQGSSALLEEIYTEVYIAEGGSGNVNEEHEVRQIESRSRRPAGQETSIKCSDIFKPLPGQHKTIRSVVTKGVAGIGKTVSVQKFILDWAAGKENQDIHFIFPLLFRELNLMREKQLSLMDLLNHFFTEIKQLTFPSQGKNKVLFIFDGLDECRLQLDFQHNESLTDVTEVTSLDVLLTNVIKGNLIPSALLWITSRPAAANQIPPDCVDRFTEVQGFNDPQKEEYFRKRIIDQNLASKVISHIKLSRSLHSMCHIPVFCWIAATVLAVILGSSGGGQIPKTLTEMYTYFLIFQTKQRSLKFENVQDLDPQWNQEVILGLGKLAYEQLENGNLIFYEEDLKKSGIDVREAVVYSGICSQIFREESGLHQGKVFCFVHLSVQEYLAALYVFLMMAVKGKYIISRNQAPEKSIHLWKRIVNVSPSMKESMIILHKSAVDKALEHEDGRFDLFLRFLLGLSLESNQTLLHGLQQRRHKQMGNEETISYIRAKIREVPSSERVINLFHCLNELDDHSLVDEVQRLLSAGILSEAEFSPAQWSALVFVLLTSEQNLDVFDLKNYIRSDQGFLRLQPVVEKSQKAQLNSCRLTERSCTVLACILSKASSNLKNVDLSGNSIGDIGVQELCKGLKNPNCALEKLSLSYCSITAEGFRALASALRSNPSHMRKLQLSGNKAGDSGVKHLSSLLEDSNCKLEKLHLLRCSITDEGFSSLASALRSNPSHMRELQLSGNKAGDSGVKYLSSLLDDPNYRLDKLDLLRCSITKEGFSSIASPLRSNPSHMRELQLSGNGAGDSGVKQLYSLLEDLNCKPEKVLLLRCSITEEGFSSIASALRELQLSGNEAGDSGWKNIDSALESCKLEKLQICVEGKVNSESQRDKGKTKTKTLDKEKLLPEASETHRLEKEWPRELLKILNSLNKREFKEFVFHLCHEVTVPEAESLDRVDFAFQMLKIWGTSQCISKTEDLLKYVKRNDLVKNLGEFRKVWDS